MGGVTFEHVLSLSLEYTCSTLQILCSEEFCNGKGIGFWLDWLAEINPCLCLLWCSLSRLLWLAVGKRLLTSLLRSLLSSLLCRSLLLDSLLLFHGYELFRRHSCFGGLLLDHLALLL